MIKTLADFHPGHYGEFIYDLLKELPHDLCVDVGAANGDTARKIRAAGSNTRVVAYEPFPGNTSLFRQQTSDLTNIELNEVAVADYTGHSTFIVPKIVTGLEQGWEDQKGYSSQGFLQGVRPASSTLRRLFKGGAAIRLVRQIVRREKMGVLRVPVTSLDHELGSESSIDFVKIDTQGAEYQVLLGASTLLSMGRIGCLYIEVEDHDDPRILEILETYDYSTFDSLFYVYNAEKFNIEALCERAGAEEVDADVRLSSGYSAVRLRVRPGMSVAGAIATFEEMDVRFHVDVIAVHKSRLSGFINAVSALGDHSLDLSESSGARSLLDS